MKIYLYEFPFERFEPKDDHPHRYDFETLIEVDDVTVSRWRQAITDYDLAQAEMRGIMNHQRTANRGAITHGNQNKNC